MHGRCTLLHLWFLPVLFELCFCRWHVLQTARTVMGIHLNKQIYKQFLVRVSH